MQIDEICLQVHRYVRFAIYIKRKGGVSALRPMKAQMENNLPQFWRVMPTMQLTPKNLQ
jgi:hypothetical protein